MVGRSDAKALALCLAHNWGWRTEHSLTPVLSREQARGTAPPRTAPPVYSVPTSSLPLHFQERVGQEVGLSASIPHPSGTSTHHLSVTSHRDSKGGWGYRFHSWDKWMHTLALPLVCWRSFTSHLVFRSLSFLICRRGPSSLSHSHNDDEGWCWCGWWWRQTPILADAGFVLQLGLWISGLGGRGGQGEFYS